jgi:hypothetical protein
MLIVVLPIDSTISFSVEADKAAAAGVSLS